jgi:hypothetical protein
MYVPQVGTPMFESPGTAATILLAAAVSDFYVSLGSEKLGNLCGS